jgi:hypothetical protein
MKVLFFLFIIPSVIFFFLIREFLDMRRRSRGLERWKNFNEKTISWAKEIQDSKVKEEYVKYCMEMLVATSSTKVVVFSEEEQTQKIIDKFGNHIPSIVENIRDKKINEILNGTNLS